jgi:hypothetical protein
MLWYGHYPGQLGLQLLWLLISLVRPVIVFAPQFYYFLLTCFYRTFSLDPFWIWVGCTGFHERFAGSGYEFLFPRISGLASFLFYFYYFASNRLSGFV